jgi:hypothetical protein
LLAVPAQRPHSLLPIHRTIIVSPRHFLDDELVLEPAFVPLANWLRSAAIELQRHHSVAQDAFAPSTSVVAALRDISPNRSLFAVGGGFDVALRWRWKLKEELFGSELESDET